MKVESIDQRAPAPPPTASPRKPRWGRWMKPLRRIHMYTGLVMFPWILLYGVSGILFNHPTVGERIEGHPIGAEALGDLPAWSAERAAAELVAELNARSSTGTPYRLDPSSPPSIAGFTILHAPSPDGAYVAILDVTQPRGVLTVRHARPQPPRPPFAGEAVPLESFSTAEVAERARGLLEAHDLPVVRELEAHPKIGPELRLRVLDGENRAWNVSYDFASQRTDGRPADAAPNLGLGRLLAKLHTTHHFTFDLGPLWFWALFQDLLGLTMVFWVLSGLAMWWQMKPTRRFGLVSIVASVLLAAWVMGGTAEVLTFGPASGLAGPGDDG